MAGTLSHETEAHAFVPLPDVPSVLLLRVEEHVSDASLDEWLAGLFEYAIDAGKPRPHVMLVGGGVEVVGPVAGTIEEVREMLGIEGDRKKRRKR